MDIKLYQLISQISLELQIQAFKKLEFTDRGKEAVNLIRKCINEERPKRLKEVANLVEEKLVQKELELFFKESLERGVLSEICRPDSINILKEPARTKWLELILRYNIENGWISTALEISDQTGHSLTKEELNFVFQKSFETGWISEAQKAAELLDIKLSQSEIEHFIEKYLANGLIIDAIETSDLLKEPARTKWLELILEKCLCQKDLNPVEKIMELLLKD